MQDFESLRKNKALGAFVGLLCTEALLNEDEPEDKKDTRFSQMQKCVFDWIKSGKQKPHNLIILSTKKLYDSYQNLDFLKLTKGKIQTLQELQNYLKKNVQVCAEDEFNKGEVPKFYDTDVMILSKIVPMTIATISTELYAIRNFTNNECFLVETSLYNADYQLICVHILKSIINSIDIKFVITAMKNFYAGRVYAGIKEHFQDENKMKEYEENTKICEDWADIVIPKTYAEIRDGRINLVQSKGQYETTVNTIKLIIAVLYVIHEANDGREVSIMVFSKDSKPTGEIKSTNQIKKNPTELYSSMMKNLKEMTKKGLDRSSVIIVGTILGALVANQTNLNIDLKFLKKEGEVQKLINDNETNVHTAVERWSKNAVTTTTGLPSKDFVRRVCLNINLQFKNQQGKHYDNTYPFFCDPVPSKFRVSNHVIKSPRKEVLAKLASIFFWEASGTKYASMALKNLMQYNLRVQQGLAFWKDYSDNTLDEESTRLVLQALGVIPGYQELNYNEKNPKFSEEEINTYVEYFAYSSSKDLEQIYQPQLMECFPTSLFANDDVRNFFGANLDIFYGFVVAADEKERNKFGKFTWGGDKDVKKEVIRVFGEPQKKKDENVDNKDTKKPKESEPEESEPNGTNIQKQGLNIKNFSSSSSRAYHSQDC